MYVKCEGCKKCEQCDYLKKSSVEANNCDEYVESDCPSFNTRITNSQVLGIEEDVA